MKIAYVMSRFPHLPETFILREMSELERQGWQVALYPLIQQSETVKHQDAERWLARAHFVPFLSAKIVAENGRFLQQNSKKYKSVWWQVLIENRSSPNFLMRAAALLPKAVYTAQAMQMAGITHIHAHYASHPALMAWIIHRLTGISYSITVHAHDIFVRTAMLTTKLRDAKFIAAISEFNRDYLANLVGEWVRPKTEIIHCGIMPQTFRPASVPQPLDRFEIMCIGSLQPYKGHSYLVEACKQLQQRGIPFRCRIIGEGEERPVLEHTIRDAGLTDSVHLLGAKTQEEVAQLLPTAHCYVQPSIITPSGKMEGIPVSIMEALACSLPVIASHLSGIPEIIRPGDTGYLVPPADAEALADALETVHRTPDNAGALAENGRLLVLNEFELTDNTRKLIQLFEQYLMSKVTVS